MRDLCVAPCGLVAALDGGQVIEISSSGETKVVAQGVRQSAMSVDFQDGVLAVGFQQSVKAFRADPDGKYAQVFEVKKTTDNVSIVKLCNSGKMLAYSTFDGKIEINNL